MTNIAKRTRHAKFGNYRATAHKEERQFEEVHVESITFRTNPTVYGICPKTIDSRLTSIHTNSGYPPRVRAGYKRVVDVQH